MGVSVSPALSRRRCRPRKRAFLTATAAAAAAIAAGCCCCVSISVVRGEPPESSSGNHNYYHNSPSYYGGSNSISRREKDDMLRLLNPSTRKDRQQPQKQHVGRRRRRHLLLQKTQQQQQLEQAYPWRQSSKMSATATATATQPQALSVRGGNDGTDDGDSGDGDNDDGPSLSFPRSFFPRGIALPKTLKDVYPPWSVPPQDEEDGDYYQPEEEELTESDLFPSSPQSENNEQDDDPPSVVATLLQSQKDLTVQQSSAVSSSSHHQQQPLLYRYYGKALSRTALAGGSLPVLLLGPNIDYFRVIGQELAAKGFSVMACERQQRKETTGNEEEDESWRLVLDLLNALRWNRVVLVGCDCESKLAVQAALQLSASSSSSSSDNDDQNRIAGLVLVGNLQQAEEYLRNKMIQEENNTPSSSSGDGWSAKSSAAFCSSLMTAHNLHVDVYLQSHLQHNNCPFTIVWDGDAPFMDAAIAPSVLQGISPQALAAARNRSLILGGGAAPHRRRPELFAWTVARFVEERIAPTISVAVNTVDTGSTPPLARGGQQDMKHQNKQLQQPQPRPIHSKVRLSEFFSSPGSFVVSGRFLATAIFYGALLKIVFYQYSNGHCHGGGGTVVSAQSAVQTIQTLTEKVSFWKKMKITVLSSRMAKLASAMGAIVTRRRHGKKDKSEEESAGKVAVVTDEKVDDSTTTNTDSTTDTTITATPLQEPPLEAGGEQQQQQQQQHEDQENGDSSGVLPKNSDTSEQQEQDEQPEDPKRFDFKPSFLLDKVVA